MKWLEIFSNLAMVLGFLCLSTRQELITSFKELYLYKKKKLDEFGKLDVWVNSNDARRSKYSIPIGLSLLLLGSIGLLIVSIFS